MVKKTYRKKRFTRRFKKNYRKSRMLIAPSQKIHFFKRTCAKPTILVNPTTSDYGAFFFALDDLPNYQEFTNLFQKYRIVGVKIRFIPTVTEVSAITVTTPSPASNTIEPFYYVLDYNDSTPLSTIDELLEYQNVKMFVPPSNKIKSIYFKPKATVASYSGAFTSYAQMKGNWVDTNSPSVRYYGLKYGWNVSVRISVGLKVLCTYYIQCKETK